MNATMNEPTYSLPLGPATLAELAERLTKAHEAASDEIVACWCPVTGYAVQFHVAGGNTCFLELVGPVTEKQADMWIAETNKLPDRVKVVM